MRLIRLIIRSLLNRQLSVGLTVVTIALSVALFLSVTRLQTAARESFENTISSVDLIVGARGSDIQILLYSVFRLGDATSNMRWDSYQEVTNNKHIAWSVPIALGDSHRGYRVLGTTQGYFEHIRYAKKQPLRFAQGHAFDDLFDVVIGAKVAETLGYTLGSPVVVAHGTVSTGTKSSLHDDLPFKVSGILAPTGTPIDQTLLVSLDAIEAIHMGWESGQKLFDSKAEAMRARTFEPTQITAAFVGLNNRIRLFKVQRAITQHPNEPLSAVLPGVALSRLWSIVGAADQAFKLITGLIVLVAILGMVAMTIAGLGERRREMAIFRSLGATPRLIAGLLILESATIALFGCLLGYGVMWLIMRGGLAFVQNTYGLQLTSGGLSGFEALTLLAIIVAASIAALIPALQSYRQTLQDGLTVRT